MIAVYILTIIITGCWLLKIVNRKSLIVNRTPLDIPLLLFLGANILSTIFSIDQHTSIWGYYSRSNGGLLSLISYLLLYWAFVSNIEKEQVFKLLKIGIFSGVIISLWAISEHFGVSPSCVILRQELNADCWIQDVQTRVFATLGQPNWLAAYLAMLIFPCIYFVLTAVSRTPYILYTIYSILIYSAFTFTYSRGATLGLIAGFIIFIGFQLLRLHPKGVSIEFKISKSVLIVLLTFILINTIFGSALSRFHLTKFFPDSSTPGVFGDSTPGVSGTTQLESGGTESGQIRLIVWRGALDIFKHYPAFGSGTETFAYSYYQYRPAAHNLVSEWDFLYNKAHNEFLNYLATTGIVGFGSYCIIIITFIIFILRRSALKNRLLTTALLASYISYLVQNFFGFSVVIIALFFYLFPAMAFVATDSIKPLKLPRIVNFPLSIVNLVYRRRLYIRTVQIIILLFTFYLLFSVSRLWLADSFFAKGEKASEGGNPGKAYNELSLANTLNPGEPYYESELSYSAAAAALSLQDDASLSGQLKDEAVQLTEKVLKENPNNTSFWRTAIRTYFELSGLDKTYTDKTLSALDQTIKLAPTDPKLLYNKAVILGEEDRNDEAIQALQKAIDLKPNYRDGYFALSLFYFDKKERQKAIDNMNMVLTLAPNDPEALQQLKDWENKP